MLNYKLGKKTPCWPLNTESIDYKLEVKLFPNPVTDQLIIELPFQPSTCSLFVYDVPGNRVLSKQYTAILNKRITLPLEQLAKSLYTIQIVADHKYYIGKFILE